MPALAAFVRIADALIRLIGRGAAWLVLATVLICAGVALSRYLLGFGRIWLQELYVVCFAACFLLVAPYAYATDSHIRIEILHQRWSARTRAWIEIAGCVLFLVPWLLLLLWSTCRSCACPGASSSHRPSPAGCRGSIWSRPCCRCSPC